MDRLVATLYPDWAQHAARIRDAVKDLTADDLAFTAGPEHAPIWALAAHLAGTRVYWLCGVYDEPGADRMPWTSPLTDPGWEDDLSYPRSGEELATALDASWEVIRGCLERLVRHDDAVPFLERRADDAIADAPQELVGRAEIVDAAVAQRLGLHVREHLVLD